MYIQIFESLRIFVIEYDPENLIRTNVGKNATHEKVLFAMIYKKKLMSIVWYLNEYYAEGLKNPSI